MKITNIYKQKNRCFKHSLNYIIILLSLIVGASCDTVEPIEYPDFPEKVIVGTWKTKVFKDYFTIGGLPVQKTDPPEYQQVNNNPQCFWKFQEDGKFYVIDIDGYPMFNGVYTIKNRILYLTWSNLTVDFRIISFSDNYLSVKRARYEDTYKGKHVMFNSEIKMNKIDK